MLVLSSYCIVNSQYFGDVGGEASGCKSLHAGSWPIAWWREEHRTHSISAICAEGPVGTKNDMPKPKYNLEYAAHPRHEIETNRGMQYASVLDDEVPFEIR